MYKKGFTLVELLAVIAILAILIIIALPNILKMFNNAKRQVFLTEIKTLYKESEKKVISEATKGNIIDTISSSGSTKLSMTGNNVQYCISLENGKVSSISVSNGDYYVVIPNIRDINGIELEDIQDGGYENLTCVSNAECAENPFEEGTLKYRILSDNCVYPDNVASEYVENEDGIDFTKNNDGCYYRVSGESGIQTCDGKGNNSNGRGVYYTTDPSRTENGEIVYYYRGNVKNNYITLAGYCWRILRTVEDGSIRLFYWGEANSNGSCSTDAEPIAEARFNNTYGDNAYTGYMMGLNNTCTSGGCAGGSNSTSYNQAHSNTYSSTIKKVIDAWYTGTTTSQTNCIDDEGVDSICNFTSHESLSPGYTEFISDTPYCNDRSIAPSRTVWEETYTELGYGTNFTLYGPTTRLGLGTTGTDWSDLNNNPTLVCSQNNDKFTVSSGNGNGALTYPIGLITTDEAIMAGGSSYYDNEQTYYLNTDHTYWTMSSSNFNGHAAARLVYGDGALDSYSNVNEGNAVFPVISLIPEVAIDSGSGTASQPYHISVQN
jgi:prepilin-type N-terminal cleavage/methylation domain-containing protein